MDLSIKKNVYFLLSFIVVFVLAGRLVQLQIVNPEEFGRERIGDIQRKISPFPVGCEERQVIVISHEVAVRLAGTHLF